MFGREINLPIDIVMGRPSTDPHECVHEYVEWLAKSITKAFKFARQNMRLGVKRQKLYHDRKAVKVDYKAGDWVWYLNVPESKLKLGKPWTGPFKVIKKMSEVTYLIDRRGKEVVVHVSHLLKSHSTTSH